LATPLTEQEERLVSILEIVQVERHVSKRFIRQTSTWIGVGDYNRSKDKLPWMGQRVTKGKRIRKAFATKKEALAWETTTENPQVISSAVPQKTLSVSLIEWATKYLEYAQNKFVHNTFDEKRRAFRLLLNYDEIDPSGSSMRWNR